MSENQTHNPEASKQTIADLYQQAANYLESMIEQKSVTIKPAPAPFQVNIGVDVPTFNGKRLHLKYDRANRDDDPTEVNGDIPLVYTDETGENHWWTPIGLKVYSESGDLLHDYDVMTTEDPESALAYDKHGEVDPITGNLPTVTSLDANELMAHLEWALEQQIQS